METKTTVAERAEMVAAVRNGDSALEVAYKFDVDLMELLALVAFHEGDDAVELLVHEV